MNNPDISKKDLEHLAKLAHVELAPKEEKALLADLQNILGYVAELQAVDTEGVAPMNGGTLLHDVLRADNERKDTNRGEGTDAFPETQDGYLKVPPVFE